MLFKLSVFVGLLAAVLVMLEKHLPETYSPPTDVSQLPKHLQDWHKRGKEYNVHGRKMFAIVEGKGPETIVLLHGYPSSSYDYHRALPELTRGFKVVVFDHLGFGLSDKPNDTYVYSMADQAEMALSLLAQLGVDSAHLVAHDMGDSILTEILARWYNNALPDRFKKLPKSVTFTNGGMVYAHANMRTSQYLMKTKGLGEWASSLMSKLPREWVTKFIVQQLQSVWSPTYSDNEAMEEDIKDMLTLHDFRGGNLQNPKTIRYLHDRQRFEPRWLYALSQLDVPVMLFWGDSDAVAPMDIPKALVSEGHINTERFTGKTMKGAGHFLMLENPKAWASTIKEFIKASPTA